MTMFPNLYGNGGTIIAAFMITNLENNIPAFLQLHNENPNHKVYDIKEMKRGDRIGYIVTLKPLSMWDKIKRYLNNI